jgi:hypothetical protein
MLKVTKKSGIVVTGLQYANFGNDKNLIFKTFSGNDPFIGVKTCRESEFDIFETKKRFPASGY